MCGGRETLVSYPGSFLLKEKMSLGTRLGRDPQESEEDHERVEGGGRKTLGVILPHHGIRYSQQCPRKVVAIFISQQQEFTCTGNIMEWNWSSVPTDSEEARQIDD